MTIMPKEKICNTYRTAIVHNILARTSITTIRTRTSRNRGELLAAISNGDSLLFSSPPSPPHDGRKNSLLMLGKIRIAIKRSRWIPHVFARVLSSLARKYEASPFIEHTRILHIRINALWSKIRPRRRYAPALCHSRTISSSEKSRQTLSREEKLRPPTIVIASELKLSRKLGAKVGFSAISKHFNSL